MSARALANRRADQKEGGEALFVKQMYTGRVGRSARPATVDAFGALELRLQ